MAAVDAVTVMSYRDTATGPDSITGISGTALATAATARPAGPAGRRDPVARRRPGRRPSRPSSASTQRQLDRALADVDAATAGHPTYAGIAVHDHTGLVGAAPMTAGTVPDMSSHACVSDTRVTAIPRLRKTRTRALREHGSDQLTRKLPRLTPSSVTIGCMNLADATLLQEIRPSRARGRDCALPGSRAGGRRPSWPVTWCRSGYVSRLESGQRRPNAEVLEALAQRLDVSIDQLLRGPTAPRAGRDPARPSTSPSCRSRTASTSRPRSGPATPATAPARSSHHELADRAQLPRRAGAREPGQRRRRDPRARAAGRHGAAIPRQPASAAIPRAALPAIPRVKAAIALSRCYRESGDLSLAIDLGERVLVELDGHPARQHRRGRAARRDGGRRLLRARRHRPGRAHLPQGDRQGRAARTRPKARASAYWNASMMESERGSVADAIPLAERALALLAEGQDGRNLARLRIGARRHAAAARPAGGRGGAGPAGPGRRRSCSESSASAIDLARNDVYRARALLLAGDLEAARELSARSTPAMREHSPIAAADAKAVEGQAAAASAASTRPRRPIARRSCC